MGNTKTSTGLEPNIAGLLCYAAGWITGLVFYFVEKEDRFVRFHAMQSNVVFGALTVAGLILGVIPILGWIIGWLLGILGLVLWILLMVKAYQGQMYKVKWAGDFAEKHI